MSGEGEKLVDNMSIKPACDSPPEEKFDKALGFLSTALNRGGIITGTKAENQNW